jgi:hypothetical protein
MVKFITDEEAHLKEDIERERQWESQENKARDERFE